MTTKTVLFILNDLDGGGAQKVFITVANEIAKNKNFNIHLVVLNNVGPYKNLLSRELIVHYLSNPRNHFKLVRVILKLVLLIRRVRPAATVSTLNLSNILNILCSKISFNKHRIIIREANTPSCYFQNAALKKKLVMYTMRTFFHFSDLCVCPSEGVKEDVEKFYKTPKDKLIVIKNPVNFGELEKKSLEPLLTPDIYKKRVILSVGRLTYAKGYDVLLQAMPKVLQHYDVNLVILGEGIEKERLQQQARDLGIEKNVFFPGFVSNPYPFYKHASLFVLPSRWEGSPNALIHAISLGIPIVATDCKSGPAELVANKTLLSPINNSQLLTNSILKQLKNKRVEDLKMLRELHDINVIVKRYIQSIEDRLLEER